MSSLGQFPELIHLLHIAGWLLAPLLGITAVACWRGHPKVYWVFLCVLATSPLWGSVVYAVVAYRSAENDNGQFFALFSSLLVLGLYGWIPSLAAAAGALAFALVRGAPGARFAWSLLALLAAGALAYFTAIRLGL